MIERELNDYKITTTTFSFGQMYKVEMWTGIAIGIMLMMIVNINKEQTIDYCCNGDIEEIEFSVCEDCWYEVFDGGETYQY